ncbi:MULTISPECIES: IS3 family transposase [unclassified Paraburkholderia]|jgi:transposase InsO family protein|uniref:IS3 family transposase n=1 Tax=unclassified Paraburkholderia TaxID=2615204 RepID=UPI0038BB4363
MVGLSLSQSRQLFGKDNYLCATRLAYSRQLDNAIRWYNAKRIKISLGSLSPLEYRESLGIAAYTSPRF